MNSAVAPTAVGLSRLHFPVTSLGYGKRIGLWLQGCSIRCKGCMSLDTWQAATRPIEIDQLVANMAPWFDLADGLTVSGGEPFDQPAALKLLLSRVRPFIRGDILVFTGYNYNDLTPEAVSATTLIDTLIAGPFDQERACGRPLVASDNQTVHLLTDLGAERYAQVAARDANIPRMDVIADGAEFWLAGIPRPGDLERLSRILDADGLTMKTSAGRIGGRP